MQGVNFNTMASFELNKVNNFDSNQKFYKMNKI